MRCIPFSLIAVLCVSGLLNVTMAAQPESGPTQGDFSGALQTLKQQSLELERDLLSLEQQITRPISIYLTLDTDSRYFIEKLVLKLDGQDLLTHEYRLEERQALNQGGAQLLYNAPLEAGKHRLIAYYQSNKGYQGGTEYEFIKTDHSIVLKLHIFSNESKESRLKPLMKIVPLEGGSHAR